MSCGSWEANDVQHSTIEIVGPPLTGRFPLAASQLGNLIALLLAVREERQYAEDGAS